MLLVELVEGVEKFLLGGFLAGDKLDIVNQKQIRFPVLAVEFNVLTGLNGGNQLVGKLVAPDVDNVGVGILLADAVGNGVKQVGLTHAGRAVEKQRVIHLAGMLGHRQCGAVGKPVGGAHHEVIKGELGIEIHGGGFFILAPERLQLLVAEHGDLGVGIENFLQRVMDIIGAAILNNTPTKFV